jgi:hypothetical protein
MLLKIVYLLVRRMLGLAVLRVTVPDLHTLRTPHVDRVLPRPRPGLIDQAHQRFGSRHQTGIIAGSSLIQLRHERRLPRLRGLFMSGQHQLGVWPAAKPFPYQSLQPRVCVLDR